MGFLDKSKQTGQQPLLSSSSSSSKNKNQQQQQQQSASGVLTASTNKLQTTTVGNGETSENSSNNPACCLNGDKILSASSSNLKISGSKKASYSFCNENAEPSKKQKSFYHDNPSFESAEPSANKAAQSNTLLNSVHKNHEEIHLTQLKSLDSMNLNSSSLDAVSAKNQNNGGTAYAIASSTTLLYITPPHGPQSPGQLNNNSTLSPPPPPPPPPPGDVSQSQLTSLASYNTAEKLAAAAAHAVSSAAASVVEIPNFSEGLSSMMHNNRIDEMENARKLGVGETKINQAHGFAFGEGNDCTKATYTKSAATMCHLTAVTNGGSNSTVHSRTMADDDPNIKLTHMSSSSSAFDVKVKRKRACQMKVLVVLLAMMTAACIGCIVAFFYMKYQRETELHLNYTQNMVVERASKFGSNKLEVVVLFNATAQDLEDKNALANKVIEIVYSTFTTMNKTVEVIDLFEFLEYAPNSFKTTIDVELKNAADFTLVPLLIEPTDGTIRVAETAPLLVLFRATFKNITQGLNLNPNLISIDSERVEILFDQKPASAVVIPTGVDSPRLFTTTNSSDDFKQTAIDPSPPTKTILSTLASVSAPPVPDVAVKSESEKLSAEPVNLVTNPATTQNQVVSDSNNNSGVEPEMDSSVIELTTLASTTTTTTSPTTTTTTLLTTEVETTTTTSESTTVTTTTTTSTTIETTATTTETTTVQEDSSTTEDNLNSLEGHQVTTQGLNHFESVEPTTTESTRLPDETMASTTNIEVEVSSTDETSTPKVVSLKEMILRKQQDLNRLLNGPNLGKKRKNGSKAIDKTEKVEDTETTITQEINEEPESSPVNKELEADLIFQPMDVDSDAAIKPNGSSTIELAKNIQRTIEFTELASTREDQEAPTTEDETTIETTTETSTTVESETTTTTTTATTTTWTTTTTTYEESTTTNEPVETSNPTTTETTTTTQSSTTSTVEETSTTTTTTTEPETSTTTTEEMTTSADSSVSYLSKKAVVETAPNEMNVELLLDSRDDLLSDFMKRLN